MQTLKDSTIIAIARGIIASYDATDLTTSGHRGNIWASKVGHDLAELFDEAFPLGSSSNPPKGASIGPLTDENANHGLVVDGPRTKESS